MISSPEKSLNTHVYNYDTILNGTKYKVKFKVCKVIKYRFLPLNVGSVFDFKMKSYESVI